MNPVEKCSCDESEHLRAALARIRDLCEKSPGTAHDWIAIGQLSRAALSLNPLPSPLR